MTKERDAKLDACVMHPALSALQTDVPASAPTRFGLRPTPSGGSATRCRDCGGILGMKAIRGHVAHLLKLSDLRSQAVAREPELCDACEQRAGGSAPRGVLARIEKSFLDLYRDAGHGSIHAVASPLIPLLENRANAIGDGAEGWVLGACDRVAPSTDEDLTSIAVDLWPLTYGRPGAAEDDDGATHVSAAAAAWASMVVPTEADVFKYLFAAKWAHAGYTKIVTSHKYAAALAATNLDRTLAEDIHLPGAAFLIAVPNGILEVEHGGRLREYERIAIGLFGGTCAILLFDRKAASAGGGVSLLTRKTMTELLFGDVEDDVELADGFAADVGAERRILLIARRIVVGLLLAMQNPENLREVVGGGAGGGGGGRKRAAPQHRIVLVGRPLDVDCRPAVRAFLRGERHAAPAVQTLVRGHHKRQVFGVGRAERRVIWVEPYWRGPEDAPILARPMRVAGPREGSSNG